MLLCDEKASDGDACCIFFVRKEGSNLSEWSDSKAWNRHSPFKTLALVAAHQNHIKIKNGNCTNRARYNRTAIKDTILLGWQQIPAQTYEKEKNVRMSAPVTVDQT